MIRFTRVGRRFGGRAALSDLSFEIASGEMVFLTGHSGAGKTTLLRLIGGLEREASGDLEVDGVNPTRLKRVALARHRRKVGMIFQDHRLLLDRSVFDNVILPLQIDGMDQNEAARRVRAALELVGLGGREGTASAVLSAGEQQRVGIARALVRRPPIIVADEPTGNLDPELSADIMRLFDKLHQLGLTIVVASHDLELVRRMRRRVLVLQNGRLLDDIAREELA